MEFIDIDVCKNSNRPVMSKHELLSHWPPFTTARDVTSFIGFLDFYSRFIPYFEQQVAQLSALSNQSMEAPVGALTEAQAKLRLDMIDAICSDPYVACFDSTKQLYLMTDFSKMGFRFSVFQPSDNHVSLAAMHS